MSARRIGGTDMGPIVAMYRPELAAELAKYANASDVWMRLVHDIERPRSKVMERGIDAEPRLRKAYLDAFGGVAEEHERPWVVQHPRFPWATVSPDDVVRDDSPLGTADADPMTVECERTYVEYKSTSVFARHKWGPAESDEVPPLYQLQVQHGLEILGLPVCHLFVGFGRDIEEGDALKFLYEETRRYVIQRDAELAEMALGYAEQFHRDFVERRKPPPLVPVHNKREFSRLTKEAVHE